MTRERSSRDGRGRVVRLTPEGLSRIDQGMTAHLANERELVAPLSGAEQEQLARLLAKWARAIEGAEGND